jgi:hypothetical protein
MRLDKRSVVFMDHPRLVDAYYCMKARYVGEMGLNVKAVGRKYERLAREWIGLKKPYGWILHCVQNDR